MEDERSKDSAAKLLLGEVIDSLLDMDSSFSAGVRNGSLKLSVDAEGWALLICNTKGREGYGDISFVYSPRGFVTKLFEETEKKYDEMTALCHYENQNSTKRVLLRDNIVPEFREKAIHEAVKTSIFSALEGLLLTMGKAFQGQYRDALVIAEGVLKANVAGSLDGQTFEEDGDRVIVLEVEKSMRASIEARVEEVAREKGDYFRAIFNNISTLRVPTGKPGRPARSGKSAEDRQREKLEFGQQIEETYRRLRATSGKGPTKTHLAQELRIGGRSPHTGNDTSLNAFNSKLERLTVDYDAIVRRIELNG